MERWYRYKEPNGYCTRILQKYSTKGWVYRPGQAWVFEELTQDELSILKASYEIPRTNGRKLSISPTALVRFPRGTVIGFRGDYTRGLANWFARCTITVQRPLAHGLFRVRVAVDGMQERFEYPLEPGDYESWLWADEVAICRDAGCEVTVHSGYGWQYWVPPTLSEPQSHYQERTFIYALVDPLTKEVYYVGKADNPQRRLVEHLKDTSNRNKAAWIQRLRAQGHVPMLTILEEVDGAVALERERLWIMHYREQSHPLTNSTSLRGI